MSILNNINVTEYAAKQYYIHNSYTPIYYYTYLRLQKWIADNIFREDISRVFMASDAYAFRRRFELTDMSKNFEDIDFSSLRFPFANYWPQNSGWVGDKRLAANTAALLYLGIYEGTTKINAAASTIDIPTTFYFDREDDARLAYEILYFKSFNKHYYNVEIPFAGETLKVPVNMEITNVQFNPQFNETDWLKKQRIFIIKATFKLYSYAITPPAQPYWEYQIIDGYICDASGNRIQDPEGNYLYYEDYDGREHNSLVNDVILNFSNSTDREFKTYEGLLNFPEDTSSGFNPNALYIDSTYVPASAMFWGGKVMIWNGEIMTWNSNLWSNKTSTNSPKGWMEPTVYRYNRYYTNPDPEIPEGWKHYEVYLKKNVDIDSIRVNGSANESDIRINQCAWVVYDSAGNPIDPAQQEIMPPPYSAKLTWSISESDEPDVDHLELLLSNNKNPIYLASDVREYELSGLPELSTYYAYLQIFAKDGKTKVTPTSFTTPEQRSSEVITEREAPASSLVGTIW